MRWEGNRDFGGKNEMKDKIREILDKNMGWDWTRN